MLRTTETVHPSVKSLQNGKLISQFSHLERCLRSEVSKLEDDSWKLLNVFGNEVRVKIVRLLLQFEWRSLSGIAKKLESDRGKKMTLPGVLKHLRELESVGIVRHESGVFADKPDARKTIYLLEGRERVEKTLKQLEDDILSPLLAGVTFKETSKLARKVQGIGPRLAREDSKQLESLLTQCESEKVQTHLTEDEKKKIKLWRIMAKLLKE